MVEGVTGTDYKVGHDNVMSTDVIRGFRPKIDIEPKGITKTKITVTNGEGDPLQNQQISLDGAETDTAMLNSNGVVYVNRTGQALTVDIPGATPSDIASNHANIENPYLDDEDVDFDGKPETRYELYSERTQYSGASAGCIEGTGQYSSGKRICDQGYLSQQAPSVSAASTGKTLQLRSSKTKTFYLWNPLLIRLVLSILSSGVAASPLIIIYFLLQRAHEADQV
jgi:hypothetical protein